MSSSVDSQNQALGIRNQHAVEPVAGSWLLLLPLLSAFLFLALLYGAVVPLGEGPDEPGHVGYVLFLAREGRLPVQQVGAASDVPGEGHQPPLAYALALPAVAWLPTEQQRIVLSANPNFVWDGGQQPAAFSRGTQERWPWGGTVLAWHLARGVAALLGSWTVFCTWLIGRRLGLAPGLALLAAALVAFNPQFIFASAIVTNDTLLAALSGAALLASLKRQVRTSHQEPKTINSLASEFWEPAVLGALIGLALITKQSALLLLPLLPLAAYQRYGWWLQALRFVAVGSCVVLLVSGWWYLRNARLYGDLLGLGAFRAEFITQPWEWRDPAAVVGALIQLHESFWARFGWMSVPAPGWFYWGIGALELVALVGLAAQVARARFSPPLCFLQPAIWLLPLLAMAWTTAFALTAGLVAWQGRFLFPALPAIAVLLAQGLGFWFAAANRGTGGQGNTEQQNSRTAEQQNREQRTENSRTADQRTENREQRTAEQQNINMASKIRSFVPLFLCSYVPLFLCSCVPLFLLLAVIAPTYPWYTLPAEKALAEAGQPIYLRFAEAWKQGVELRGWRQEGLARAGDSVIITLTWHALEQVPRDWTVFLHLADERGRVVAERNSQPLDGALPMRQWTAGDWLQDVHSLPLPPNLPPGRYMLRLGLYDASDDDQRRQAVWNVQGEFLDDSVDLTPLLVAAP